MREPPRGVRYTADLNAATIRLRPTRTTSSWVTLSAVLLFNLIMLAISVRMMHLPLWALCGLMLLMVNGVWLLSQRHLRSTHIILDANILDVRQSRFGAHYRIPLTDILDIRFDAFPRSGVVLTLELPDDAIQIGQSCTDTQLRWLQDILLQSTAAAQGRPAQREGLPEEIPHSLRALRAGRPSPK